MTNTLIKLAISACLVSPLAATAVPMTTYSGMTASDSYSFTLDQLSSVSIGYSWVDMVLAKGGGHRYFDPLLAWELTDSSKLTGSSKLSGILPNAEDEDGLTRRVLSLGNLAEGSYTLTLTGTWGEVKLPGNGNTADRYDQTAGQIDLLDGDQAGTVNSFSAVPVALSPDPAPVPASSVPEPTTSAMMLLGLGALTAVRRRNKKR